MFKRISVISSPNSSLLCIGRFLATDILSANSSIRDSPIPARKKRRVRNIDPESASDSQLCMNEKDISLAKSLKGKAGHPQMTEFESGAEDEFLRPCIFVIFLPAGSIALPKRRRRTKVDFTHSGNGTADVISRYSVILLALQRHHRIKPHRAMHWLWGSCTTWRNFLIAFC